MNAPKNTFIGLTWIGWLNILLLQFFFIRLAYTKDGKFTILKYPIPFTGWSSNYKYLWKKNK